MFNLPIPPLPFPGIGLNTAVSLPVGTVVAFAGKIALSPSISPSEYTTYNIEAFGWMVCDGRQLLVSEYPELFAVLGYLYGGEGDMFNIPDYRGLFLRGVDGDANNDPDKSSRKAAAGGTQDGVGSIQDDALQTHKHTYSVESPSTGQGSSAGTAPTPATPELTSTPTDSL
ncbi:tail fiber protein [Nostoc sphaeroides]|uniref:Rhizosphere induced protein RhiB n=1 Tax=Nostoc sphaeroides CCNUC1 TaxID=2653204 RepID=A0A5P8WI92_9NOSO|nr:phage tail protein [Nostoc sphaeroides]QFS51866.1 rhizosphere induced protein RhiB [Nostoc sphaeroides CCNUC1]